MSGALRRLAILGVAAMGFSAPAAVASELSAVEAVSTAVMTTCYPMIGGGDDKAAERSLEHGLRMGAPEGFPEEPLEALLTLPDGSKVTPFHMPSSEGLVLVVAAPTAGVCSVALVGAAGEAAGAEIDKWFNGEPSPFVRVENDEGEAGWRRVYTGAETPSRPTRILTTTVRDGYRSDMPIRFLATLHRMPN